MPQFRVDILLRVLISFPLGLNIGPPDRRQKEDDFIPHLASDIIVSPLHLSIIFQYYAYFPPAVTDTIQSISGLMT